MKKLPESVYDNYELIERGDKVEIATMWPDGVTTPDEGEIFIDRNNRQGIIKHSHYCTGELISGWFVVWVQV